MNILQDPPAAGNAIHGCDTSAEAAHTPHDPLVCGLDQEGDVPLCPGCRAAWAAAPARAAAEAREQAKRRADAETDEQLARLLRRLHDRPEVAAILAEIQRRATAGGAGG